jgi:lysophospholipase L1-like esterase
MRFVRRAGLRALITAPLVALVALVAGAASCAPWTRGAPLGDASWVGTWSAAPQLVEPRNMPPAPGLQGATIRQVVHLSLGGSRVRLRLSNEFGDGPLVVAGATIARSRGMGAIDPATTRALRFGGAPGVTIVAGRAATSDPLDVVLEPLADVAVTLRLAAVPAGLTGHPGSRTTSYIQTGEHLAADTIPNAARTDHWYVVAGIDVVRPGAAAVAVLGNSIADGRGSGTNRQNRWPDNLARRLQGDARTRHVGVLNLGIGGNCVLRECIGPSGLDRLERDVLRQPGVRWLVVSEGVNDIGGARDSAAADAVVADLTAAYARIVERARARGLRVLGATILPFGGSQYDSPARERARQVVNAWIRTAGHFDAVADLDAAMRDPQQPQRLRPDVDGGDHLHPNEFGYRVMADAFDLALFTR